MNSFAICVAMKFSKLTEKMWGEHGQLRWLLLVSVVILFTFLGSKEIWTQEHRWADIVSGMFYRNDFLHPYLGENRYYDKPLLSYWLIAGFAYIFKGLSVWVLRLPSALAGLLSVWSVYLLGSRMRDKSFGLLAGWMLITTYYFVFWARVSSADVLNVGGTMLAIAWYFMRKKNAGFFSYSVFFIILALTSLCKGLIGAIIPFIAVFVDMALNKSFRQHLRLPLFFALIPGLMVYVFPFWLSSHYGGDQYGQSGLYLVYKENFLRYFQPFDHRGPIYTYFVYLPIYLMPWTLFFVPAIVSMPRRWKSMDINMRWAALTFLMIFSFFTFSGSRRSYYVLPIVPFAILLAADWIYSAKATVSNRQNWAAGFAVFSAVLIFIVIDVMPAYYYSRCGVSRFAGRLMHQAEQIRPWREWNVVLLDAESKLIYYLDLPPTTKNYDVRGSRYHQISRNLQKRWQLVKIRKPDTIVVSRKAYEKILDNSFAGYTKMQMSDTQCLSLITIHKDDMPIAYIPRQVQ